MAQANKSPYSATCPSGTEVFTVPPLDIDQVDSWIPLGNVSPPQHTFPADHQYIWPIYMFQDSYYENWSMPLLAPGNIRIYNLYKTTNANGTADYSVFFSACSKVTGRFGHVTTLTPEVLAAAGKINKNCFTYSPGPNSSIKQCSSANFNYDVEAGKQIGTVGSTSLDFWLWDRRIKPLHFANKNRFSKSYPPYSSIVPASEYFTAEVAAQIVPKMGFFHMTALHNGATQRITEPLGGSIAVDVDKTVMGHWFNAKKPYPPESSHASLIPDNLSPETMQVFSIGLSQPNSLSESVLGSFAPVQSGSVNRSFDTVTADGDIYCYEISFHAGVVLLQLTSNTKLRLEFRDGPTSCAVQEPYAFTTNAFNYVR